MYLVLGHIFHGSGFFRIGSGFLADPDPDSGKKFDPDPEKKPGSKTLQPSICKPTNAMQCHHVIQIDFSYLSDNEFALHYLYTRHFLKRFP